MNANEAAHEAVEDIRKWMHGCTGSEKDIMKEFSEALGAEVTGMDMRLDELEEEEE